MADLYVPESYSITSTALHLYDIDGKSYVDETAGEQLVELYLRPSLEAQKTATQSFIATNPSPEWDNGMLRRQEAWYFGQLASGFNNPPPNPRSWSVDRKIKPPKNKFRQFEQAISRGDIVFKDYTVSKVVVDESPLLRDVDVVLGGSHQVQSFLILNVSTVQSNGTAGPVRHLVPSKIPDRYLEVSGPRSRHLFTRHYTKFIGGANVDWYFASDVSSLKGDVEASLDSLQTIKPNTRVVTDLLCEANGIVWDILTEFAELIRETAPMIIDACIAILRKGLEVTGKIKKLKANSLSSGSLRTDIATLWLQYRYAIGPLAYSISDALAYLDMELVQYQSYRKGEERTVDFDSKSFSHSFTVVDRVLVRDKIDLGIKDHFKGLGLDPFKTGWELLPLSFIWDWVFNIGDVITASSAHPAQLKQRRVQQSQRTSETVEIKIPGFTGMTLAAYDSYVRARIQGIPGLAFFPQYRHKRLLDALAIFWGSKSAAFRRSIKRY